MSELTPKREIPAEQMPGDGRPLIQIGQWYWAKVDESKSFDWFACVTEIGSNYIRLESPNGNYERIHENDFEKLTRLEPNAEQVIRGRVEKYQVEVRHNLGQIRDITARLGIQPRETSAAPKSESRELSTFNAMPDLKKYKKELIQAKEKTLPKLFEEVEKAHENVALWMSAQALPMKAMCGGLQEAISQINDRVFNVSLYAGLTEEVVQFADGEPAPASEKLRLFQRMCFMDEECLVNYEHGGMEFKDIRDFNKWIAKIENRDRILPFPRCMVAFRVRRHTKYRHYDGSLSCAMINIQLEQADKTTFMYIRNGGRLYLMTCDFEFDEHIFPSQHQVDFTEPMMAECRCDDVDKIITRRHWEQLCRDWDDGVRKYEQFEEEHNKGKDSSDRVHNPHYRYEWSNDDPRKRYEPFDKSSVYFDDMQKQVEDRLKYYNRIALIIQGLFDRSEVLHPHPPAQLWRPGGLEAVVELVYDGAGAIHYQEPPDFAEYKDRLNASLKEGCYTIGQEDAWGRREAEAAKARNEWHTRSTSSYSRETTHYEPHGDPGPGYIGKILEWSAKNRRATYRWQRERRNWRDRWSRNDGPINCTIRVDADKLFNVSAYKPGDFRQFYQDPRTREKYLQWAPLLLAAEEWHAGNVDAKGNFKKKGSKK